MKPRKGSTDGIDMFIGILLIVLMALIILPAPTQRPNNLQEEAVVAGEVSKEAEAQIEKPSEVVERPDYRIEYYLEKGTARIIVTHNQRDKADETLGYGCSEEILQALLEIREKYFTSDPLTISTQINAVSVTRVVIVSIAPKIAAE